MRKQKKAGQGAIIRRVLAYIKPYRIQVGLMLFFAMVTVGTTLYAPVLIGQGVDQIVGAGEVDFGQLGEILLYLTVVIAATALAQWSMNLLTNQVTYRVVEDIRNQAFIHLEQVPASYVDQNQPGDILSRIVTDVGQFSDGLLMGFTQLFTGVATILGTIGFMLSINGKIALLVVLLTPISLFVASFIASRTFHMFQVQSEKRAEMTSLVEELVPKLLGIGEVQKVLQNLLKEGISVRDLLTIFETLADYASNTRDTDILTEYVRQSLKRAISGKFFPANETTSVVTLDPKLEQEIMASVKQTENGAYLTLDPEKTRVMMKAVENEVSKLENLGKNPIVITSPIVRMYFKRLTEDYFKDLIVVSYNEVENNIELQSVGMVTA